MSKGTVPPASELIRRQCGRAAIARAPPYLPQRSSELDSVAPIVGCAKEDSRVPRALRANVASKDSELAHSACLLNDATYCLAVPLVARRDKVVRSVRPVTIVAQGAHLHERRHVAGEYIKFKFSMSGTLLLHLTLTYQGVPVYSAVLSICVQPSPLAQWPPGCVWTQPARLELADSDHLTPGPLRLSTGGAGASRDARRRQGPYSGRRPGTEAALRDREVRPSRSPHLASAPTQPPDQQSRSRSVSRPE